MRRIRRHGGPALAAVLGPLLLALLLGGLVTTRDTAPGDGRGGGRGGGTTAAARSGPGGGSGSGPTAPSTPVVPEPPRTVELRVATANLFVGLGPAPARRDVERLLGRADLIGLNEVRNARARQLRSWLPPRWVLVRPTDPASPRWSGSNAVLVDRWRFELLDEGAVFGSRAAMPAYAIDSRWVTWVRLRERRTGTELVHLQTHLDAAVEWRGRPRAGAATRIAGNARYQRTVLRLVRGFATGAHVVVGGDWNVDARADLQVGYRYFPERLLLGPQPEGRLRSSYRALGTDLPPTRPYDGPRAAQLVLAGKEVGGRLVDYVALWQRRGGPTFVDQEVLSGAASDHDPLVVTVRLPTGPIRTRAAPR